MPLLSFLRPNRNYFVLPAPLTKPNSEWPIQHINGTIYFTGLPLPSFFVDGLAKSRSQLETLTLLSSLSGLASVALVSPQLSNMLVLKDADTSVSLFKSLTLPAQLCAFAIDPSARYAYAVSVPSTRVDCGCFLRARL